MATIESKKLSADEFYARRTEAQQLVTKGIITQDIMDGAMEMIARENDLLGIVDIPLNQFQHNDRPERTITILPANSNMKVSSPLEPLVTVDKPVPVLASEDIGVLALREQPLPEYISLTDLARSHHMDNPSYVIQSWLRSENTLAFLDLWERENNPVYNASA